METKILITILILFGLSLIAGIFFFITKKNLSVKGILLYLLIALVLFAGAGCAGFFEMTRPRLFYFLLQLVFLGLGVLHTWMLYKLFDWSRKQYFFSETIFTLMVGLLGGAVFLLVFYLLHSSGYHGPLASALLAFLLPYFVHKTYCLAQSMPAPVFKTWQYFPNHTVPEADLQNSIRVQFRIAKNMDVGQYSKFTIRAPMDMVFGDLFFSFLRDYNQSHPDGQIQPNSREKPFNWMFYVKPSWWQSRKVVDPDQTVKSNEIEDNALINAKRVSAQDLKL